jgi:hypothetical protein
MFFITNPSFANTNIAGIIIEPAPKNASVLTHVSISAIADFDSPLIPGCGVVRWLITVCNETNQSQNMFIRSYYSVNDEELVDAGPFTAIPNVPPLISLEANMTFQARECKTLVYTTKIANFFGAEFTKRFFATHSGEPEAVAEITNFNAGEEYTLVDGTSSPAQLSSLYGFSQAPLLSPACACAVGPPLCNGVLPIQEVVIKGTFEVNENYCFRGSNSQPANFTQVQLNGSNARIVVKSGAKLTIKNAKVFACEVMWQSIVVESGATLELDNAIIQDGEEAILLQNGANLILKNSNLIGNYVGIATPNNPGASQTFTISLSGFNEIKRGIVLISPHAGQSSSAGMLLRDVNGVNIVGSSSNTIKFSDLDIGIHAFRSGFSAKQLLFEDIDEAAAAPAVKGRAIRVVGGGSGRTFVYEGFNDATTDFLKCKTGIETVGSHAEVTKTKMEKVETGIAVLSSQSRRIKLQDNNIFATTTGIRLAQNLPGVKMEVYDNWVTIDNDGALTSLDNWAGIRADESYNGHAGYYVQNNLVTLNNAVVGIKVTDGFALRFANNTITMTDPDRETWFGFKVEGSSIPLLHCNEVDGNGSASNWRNGAAFYANTTDDGRFRCNLSNETETGLLFDGVQDATTLAGNYIAGHCLGLQINGNSFIGTQRHRGNQWIGSNYGNASTGGVNGCFGAVTFSNPSASRFIIDEVENQDFNTSTNTQNWFTLDPDPADSYDCAEFNTCPQGIGSNLEAITSTDPVKTDDLDLGIVNDGLNPSLCADAVHWTGKRQLYARLKRNTNHTGLDPAIQEFFTNAANRTIGQFYDVEEDVAALFVNTPAVQTQLDGYKYSIESDLAEIWEIDSALAAGVTPSQEEALRQERSGYVANLALTTASNDSLLTVLASQRQTEASVIRTANNAIATNTVYEANEKTVNDIFLQTIAVGVGTFTQQQASALEAIATQCPPCGGKAVFRARSMYALANPEATYDDALLCVSNPNPLVQPPAAPSQGFAFYPNPAQQVVNVQLGTELEIMEREVSVLSVEGKELLRQTLPAGVKTLGLDVNRLLPGAYYFTVQENGKKIHVEKIMIIH